MRRPTSYGDKLFQISNQRLESSNRIIKQKPGTPKKTMMDGKISMTGKDKMWSEVKTMSQSKMLRDYQEEDLRLPQINSSNNLQRKIVKEKALAATQTKRQSFNQFKASKFDSNDKSNLL